MPVAANQYDIFQKLQGNYKKMRIHIQPPVEKPLFYIYISTTLVYGLAHNVANACVTNMSQYLRHVVGNKNTLNLNAIRNEISAEPFGSLYIIYNQPNSTALSCNEYDYLLKYASIKSVSVCGHEGNFYFLQKGELFYKESQETINDLSSHFKEIYLKMLQLVCIGDGCTLKKLPNIDEEIQKACLKKALECLFYYVCDKVLYKYGFKNYREM